MKAMREHFLHVHTTFSGIPSSNAIDYEGSSAHPADNNCANLFSERLLTPFDRENPVEPPFSSIFSQFSADRNAALFSEASNAGVSNFNHTHVESIVSNEYEQPLVSKSDSINIKWPITFQMFTTLFSILWFINSFSWRANKWFNSRRLFFSQCRKFGIYR